MKIIIGLVFFVLWGLPAFAEEKAPSSPPTTNAPPQISEQERERLKGDAKQLAEDFKDLFKEFSATGQSLALAFVDYISVWIKENYARISEEQRRKLKQLLSKTKKEFDQFGELSAEAMIDLLKDIAKFLQEMEEELADPAEPPTDPEVIVI